MIAMILCGFIYLNREHLPVGYKYDVEAKIVDSDIQRRVETVHYYQKQSMVRQLTDDEAGNLAYHRKEIDRLRDKKQLLDK